MLTKAEQMPCPFVTNLRLHCVTVRHSVLVGQEILDNPQPRVLKSLGIV